MGLGSRRIPWELTDCPQKKVQLVSVWFVHIILCRRKTSPGAVQSAV